MSRIAAGRGDESNRSPTVRPGRRHSSRSRVGGYVLLYLGVAASWVGVPIVGAGVLNAAGVLASEGDLSQWLVIFIATVGASTGG